MARDFVLSIILGLFICTSSRAGSYRVSGREVMWFGASGWLSVDDETFYQEPKWTAYNREPPLAISQAYRIATSHVMEKKLDALVYMVERVELVRFFETDAWYYLVCFQAIVAQGDHSWHSQAPYKRLIEQGIYDGNTNLPPTLAVAVLFSGKVIEPR